MTITVQLLNTSEPTSDGRQAYLVNMVALNKAEQLRNAYGALRCKQHPQVEAMLCVRALANGTVMLDRSRLCCEEFAKELQATDASRL